MTDPLELLEHDLLDAARRQAAARRAATQVRRRSLGRLGPAVLAVALVTASAGAAAAGTLTVLRGSPIPAPRPQDAGPTQTPAAGTSRLSPLRAADPAGGGTPPWGLRTSRTAGGLVCSTVGQVVDGRLGVVGLDGRFRPLADGAVDGCGRAGPGVAVAGARTFDADRPGDVRAVVSGIAGPGLQAVTVTVKGRPRAVRTGAGGTFLASFRGDPEDLALQADLRFAGGRTEHLALGYDQLEVPDPSAQPLPAWRMRLLSAGPPERRPECVVFTQVRTDDGPVSPAACGRLTGAQDLFLAVRRLGTRRCTPADRPKAVDRFCGGPSRTAVWGRTGAGVRAVVVRGAPGGPVIAQRATATSTVLAVLPPVDPATLRIDVRLDDGRTLTVRGDQHLLGIPEALR